MPPIIATLTGSPSEASRSSALASFAAERLVVRGYALRPVHVRRLPAVDLVQARATPITLEALHSIAQASAVIVATPVYKASFSGLLKTFLDLLPQDGLRGKAVLPLATGASAGHLLALDYALRPVLSALGAYPILPSVYALDPQIATRSCGTVVLDPSLEMRLLAGVDQIVAAIAKPVMNPQPLPEPALS